MSTTIEWTDETWNPVTGCKKVSQGCKNCYAERVAARFWGDRKFTDVQVHYDRLETPLSWRKPRMVFVNSMSDLFEESVPFEFIDRVFAVMALTPEHTYQILTKRPERMLEYMKVAFCSSPTVRCTELQLHGDGEMWKVIDPSDCTEVSDWPLPNVWLGVSAEDQPTLDQRLPFLYQTPAAIRFVSAEPMLGPVSFDAWPIYGPDREKLLHWIICGGESGPGARPMHPNWARSLRDQCQAAGVPFFFKQWGEWAPGGFDRASEIQESLEIEGRLNHWGMQRIGKKAAGRLLDGNEWNEFPKVAP